MAFKGLFIGIDRYASPDVNWLTCATRDAKALHAIFSDNLGADARLLTDQQATRAAIQQEFEALAACDPDDVVVIGFSGHGTDTHQLGTYDTRLDDLPGTTIPLDELKVWFERIPSRRLVLFLDCCFSGGMGAKVLHADGVPRDLTSVDARLATLSGDGRLIVTASGPTEPAYESPRLRHGFFTYYLIEALQGAKEVEEAGRVPLYRLLEFVTRRVADAADQIGHAQHPTVRGQIDRELVWPVFTPGTLYETAFPERVRSVATADVASLAAFGFPAHLLAAWSGTIQELNPLQLSAINEYGVLNGDNLLVSAPTSSGKTMIGELAALRSILDRRRALFLLPLKALVNDKQRQFQRLYSGFGVRTIEATGETDDITPLLRGQYDIALLTYEKFAAIALASPHVLDQVGTVVVDEVQMIADLSRGANLEFLLTLIRMAARRGTAPQVVALSAVIGATNGFERWLGARMLRRTERPVPLDEGLLLSDGRFRYLDGTTGAEAVTEPLIRPLVGKGGNRDWIIPLAQRLVREGKQIIVFRESKSEARLCAGYLAEHLGLPPASDALQMLPTGDPSIASGELRTVLQRGVAFHYSDLSPDERRAVEESFRQPDSSLRVIAATTTLAMGINTPAAAVILAGLDHPTGEGPVPYSVAEYKNIIGRAGRLGHAEHGTSYLLARDPRQEHDFWNRYVRGAPEDLHSRFLQPTTDPRTLIVRVLVAARRVGAVPADEIVDFLEASFGAFLQGQRDGQWRWSRADLTAALNDLVHHGLVEAQPDGKYQLTPLGRLAGNGLCEVGSVVRLVDCLRPLTDGDVTDPALITAVQTTLELDQVLFPINKKSTQKEPQTWMQELRRQGVPNAIIGNLQRNVTAQHVSTLRAKKAVSCLLYISDRPMENIERVLTQFGGGFGGAAGAIRSVATRTCDMLRVAADIAELLHPNLDLAEQVSRLLVRLDLGIEGAAVDIGRHARAQLSRGDYRKLVAARLISAAQLQSANEARLVECLDGDHAKLKIIREVIEKMVEHDRRLAARRSPPILEPYVA
jgi:helicase